MFHEFVPKSWIYLREYRWELFKKDALAGITVGIVALPLAMTFGQVGQNGWRKFYDLTN
ncbi:MAG: hypothetical protein K2X08_00155 [Chlamydiales bacterium]|nr:hypothetical protein [Chlamydiales bacterium]